MLPQFTPEFCPHCHQVIQHPSDEERFWKKVDRSCGPDGCWLKRSYDRPDKHWSVKIHGRMIGAHRLSWIITNGPIPAGLYVCHNCPGGDRKDCVNPAHLWLGDNTENQQDASRKGDSAFGQRNGAYTHPEKVRRGANASGYQRTWLCHRGEQTPTSILTEEGVREIRTIWNAGGVSQKWLATEYGVSRPAISMLLSGKTWKHIA